MCASAEYSETPLSANPAVSLQVAASTRQHRPWLPTVPPQLRNTPQSYRAQLDSAARAWLISRSHLQVVRFPGDASRRGDESGQVERVEQAGLAPRASRSPDGRGRPLHAPAAAMMIPAIRVTATTNSRSISKRARTASHTARDGRKRSTHSAELDHPWRSLRADIRQGTSVQGYRASTAHSHSRGIWRTRTRKRSRH